jgi:hypothetical protein
VKDGLAVCVLGWLYSNYLEWVGEREGTLVDREFVRSHFPVPGSYRDFVAEFLERGGLPKELAAHLAVWEG